MDALIFPEDLARRAVAGDSSPERHAELLADPRVQRLLGPFFVGLESKSGAAGVSVAQAADALNMEARALRYWVNKLLTAGLLCEVNSGGGRAARRYRTSAPHYFVSFAQIPRLTLDALFERAEAIPLETLHRNLLALSHGAFPGLHQWGLWVEPAVGGRIEVRVGPAERAVSSVQALLREAHGPAALMCWLPLQLDFQDAKAFQRELGDLIERYQDRRGAQPYLARIAMTPILEP
ncbi:hypothetical protein [Deinococcus frigens]|uniref:hypothetical protein n=1 Tax=Deinococcus frigens TaxID=249403 RepID=UPI00049800C8|nr:hypothetical protein [Deinococcus frigens]